MWDGPLRRSRPASMRVCLRSRPGLPSQRIPGPVRPALHVSLDDEPVLVDLDGFVVYCDTESLQHRVERLVAMAQSTTQSLADTFQLAPVNSASLFQGAHSDVAPLPKIESDRDPA